MNDDGADWGANINQEALRLVDEALGIGLDRTAAIEAACQAAQENLAQKREEAIAVYANFAAAEPERSVTRAEFAEFAAMMIRLVT